MAFYHGKAGNVQWDAGADTNIANLQSWNLTTTGETAEATAMGDTWQVHLAGLKDFSGSAEGLSQIALDTTAMIGANASIEFLIDSSTGFEANAIITGITETVGIDGNGTISYTFEGNDSAGIAYAGAAGAPTASTNAFHGKTALGDYGSAFTSLREWSVSLSCSTADTSACGDTSRTRLAGVNGATASVTCVAVGDAEVDEGASVATLKLYRQSSAGTGTAASGYYTGAAICTGYEYGLDRDGVAIITYNFIFTGTVDLATA